VRQSRACESFSSWNCVHLLSGTLSGIRSDAIRNFAQQLLARLACGPNQC